MPSNYETFWDHEKYAVVGHGARSAFPTLTYDALRSRGKQVYAVDPSGGTVAGDAVYADLSTLPSEVEAVVLEVPRDETEAWVEKAADLGIKDLWIHMQRDTPAALDLAKSRGINVRHGTCAVMYNRGGYHSIHRVINKLLGKY